MNKSDSERMAGRLAELGYRQSLNKYRADLVVINTCGVRQTAEDRIYGLVPKIKKENPNVKIVLTGCLVGREDVKRRLKEYVDVWLPISQISNSQFPISKIPPAPFIKGEECDDYLKIKPKYISSFSAFVPIGNGCNNFCSYCVVPYARGREVYRPVKDILAEVRGLVKKGYKEIILIAQNVNSYRSLTPPSPPLSRGEKIDFADLLKMVNDIPGDFWIRFLTSHPKDMSDELIKTVAGCEKVCHQVHLPIQAGDDAVLKAMNRKYTVERYAELIKKVRQAMPDASITTDIIVGFPGETRKQFNNTAKLMRQVKFDMAYIARYSVRPGTAAAKLKDDVSKTEKKRREQELMKILRKTALENNKKYLGKIVEALVEGRNGRGELFGRTETAKSVKILTGDFRLVGKFIYVKILQVKDFGMEGVLMNYE